MWLVCFLISVGCPVLAGALWLLASRIFWARKRKISLFHTLFAGVFAALIFMFIPIHIESSGMNAPGVIKILLLSVFNSIQVFAAGCEFGIVNETIQSCPAQLAGWFQAWSSYLFVIAPFFTFGFVLSLFKNLSSKIQYIGAFFKEVL